MCELITMSELRHTYGRVVFGWTHPRNGSKELDSGIWVKPQYSGKGQVFGNKNDGWVQYLVVGCTAQPSQSPVVG